QVVQRLRQARVAHGHPLQHVERNGAVVQADDEDRHAWRRSLARVIWPFLMSSSMSESRAFRQSRASVDRPAAFTASRASANMTARTSYSGPTSAASRVRSQADSAGLKPPVETVTMTGPRRITDGRVYEHEAGSSAALTQTPAASP